jgi:hypothetical protein
MSREPKLLYEAPRAMRLGKQPTAAGECFFPGSGDVECSGPGNGATELCSGPGNEASLTGTGPLKGCQEAGNSAANICDASGSGVLAAM